MDLLGHLGHELRSPLAAALLHLGALERAVTAPNASVLTLTCLAQARQALASLDRVVARMAEVHRQESFTVRRERVELEAVIEEALEKVAARRPAARVQIATGGAAGLVAWLDRAAVEEILANLLRDAVKLSDGGPLRLSVERQEDGVRLLISGQSGGAELDRQESATGFDGGDSSSRAWPGAGLGLWIVHQLVYAHRGRITIDSRPGERTLFDVFLPG
jgi:signal transduction histidine kinase